MSDTNGGAALRLRNDVIMEAVESTVVGMGEMGMTPLEALTAAELILWTLMENGMKGSPAAVLPQSKAMASRVLNRLASRVEAWPAKTTEKN